MENKHLVDSNTIIHASKERDSPIAQWLETNNPYVTDMSKVECLDNWKAKNNPEQGNEKKYLEDFFAKAEREGRYIKTQQDSDIQKRAFQLHQDYNIKPNDALIAATAEKHGYTLITADNKKDFAPRLEKLNEQGNGNFKVQAYDYTNREQTFKEWNQLQTGEAFEKLRALRDKAPINATAAELAEWKQEGSP